MANVDGLTRGGRPHGLPAAGVGRGGDRFRTFTYSPLLFSIAAPLLWGSNFAVGRAVRGDVAPLDLNYWRWVVALCVLLPLTWPSLRRRLPLLLRHWRLVLALAALGVAGFNSVLYAALTRTTTTNAALIFATTPLIVVPISAWLLRERVGSRQLLGLALSLAGVAVVVCRGDLGALLGLRPNDGDLLVVAAVVIWALFSVLLKLRPPELPPLVLLTAITAVGVLALTPAAAVAGSGFAGLARAPLAALTGIVYLGLFAAALAFFLWTKGVAALGPARASQFLHLVPLSGVVLAWLFLGETLSAGQAAGAVGIAVGIAVAQGVRTPAVVRPRPVKMIPGSAVALRRVCRPTREPPRGARPNCPGLAS